MLRNKKRFVALAVMLVLILITMSVTAFASGNAIINTKEGKGFMQMITDISMFTLIAGPSVCGVCAMICMVRMGMADETDRKKWKDRILISVGCAAGIFLISGLIAWITSYFK